MLGRDGGIGDDGGHGRGMKAGKGCGERGRQIVGACRRVRRVFEGSPLHYVSRMASAGGD